MAGDIAAHSNTVMLFWAETLVKPLTWSSAILQQNSVTTGKVVLLDRIHNINHHLAYLHLRIHIATKHKKPRIGVTYYYFPDMDTTNTEGLYS